MSSEKKILNTSVAKAFKILDCFTIANQELGVTELAQKMEKHYPTPARGFVMMIILKYAFLSTTTT